MATRTRKKPGKAKNTAPHVPQQMVIPAEGKKVTVTGRPRPDEQAIDLEFVLPPDLPMHYVDNISIIHTQTEFILSFLQVQPPLIAEESDWQYVKSVQSRCVARVVMNPLRMQSFLKTLNDNFRRYVEKYAERGDADAANNPQAGSDTER